MNFRRLLAACLLMLPSIRVSADLVQYVSTNLFPDVHASLAQEFGPMTNFPPNSETTLSYYQVQGTGSVNLTFHFRADTGSFLFDFGLYHYVPELGAIDLSTTAGKVEYASRALAPGNAIRIFDDRVHNPGTNRVITLNGGDIIGFFLIPDATLTQFQTNQSSFAVNGVGTVSAGFPPPYRWPLFSLAEANPGARDQLMSFTGASILTSNTTRLLVWEDLTRTLIPGNPMPTDNRFNDLTYAIEGINPIVVPTTNAFAYEPFDYLAGGISNATAGIGFSDLFSGGGSLVTGRLDHASSDGSALRPVGNRYQTAADAPAFRHFATNAVSAIMLDGGKFGADTSVVYIAFLARVDSGTAGSGFGGLALMNGTNETLFLGVPNNAANWGVAQSFNINLSGVPADETARLLVARIEFLPGYEYIRFYIDPPFSAEPMVPNIPEFVVEDFRFDGLKLSSSGALYSFDEIRVGPTYASVLGNTSFDILERPPSVTYVNHGSNLVLQVRTSGAGPIQYQWFFYGNTIPGATNSTYSVPSAQPVDEGNYAVFVGNPTASVLLSNNLVYVLPNGAPLPVAWNNVSGGFWNVASNWNPQRVPTNSDTAIINAPGTYVVTVSNAVSVGSLVVGGDSSSPTLRIAQSGITASNSVTNKSIVELAGSTSLNATGGVVANTPGAILRVVGSSATMGATLKNSGTLNVEGSLSVFKVSAAHVNGGSINVGTNANAFITFILQSGTLPTFTNTGTITVTSNSSGNQCTIGLSGTGAAIVRNAAGGTIRGDGRFRVPTTNTLFLSDGSVSPGLSPGRAGILTWVGNYAQSPVGSLNIELGGLAPGSQHDRFSVITLGPAASATLDGTVNVSFINGFEPQLGDTFVIVTFPTRNGTFATINLPQTNRFAWDVVYTSTNVSLVVTSILIAPPSISQQPTGASVNVGDPVTFTVVASGLPPPQFQWRHNGINIPGATNYSYTIPFVQVGDGGTYTVIVANEIDAVISSPAVLIVLAPRVQAADNFADRIRIFGTSGLISGTNAFTAKEPGEPNIAQKPGGSSVWYVWRAPASGIVVFTTEGSSFDTLLGVYTGPAVNSITVLASDDDAAGGFASIAILNVVADTDYNIGIDGFGGATGYYLLQWHLEITPQQLPVITTPPTSETVAPGATHTFAVTPQGQLPFKFQWYFNGQAVPYGTNSSLTISNITEANVGSYLVEVSLDGRVVQTKAVSLQINTVDDQTQRVLAFDKLADAINSSNALVLGKPPSGPLGFFTPNRTKALAASVVRGYTGSQVFNNFGATSEGGEEIHCGVICGTSEWIPFVADEPGMLYLNTDGSSFDTVLAVYARSNGVMTKLDCNNNKDLLSLTSALQVQVPTGETNFVVVDGVFGAIGILHVNYHLVTPSILTFVERMIDGSCHLQVTGHAGMKFVIQASSDASSWLTVGTTNTATGDTYDFVDSSAGSASTRFYRAVMVP